MTSDGARQAIHRVYVSSIIKRRRSMPYGESPAAVLKAKRLHRKSD